MKYLFSPVGLKKLAEIKRKQAVLAFDYDGTLVPIIRNPHGAHLSQRTRDLLFHLANHHDVAVITGRSLKNIRQLVPRKDIYFVGNHGLENPLHPATKENLNNARRAVKSWTRPIQQLVHELDGLYFENKKVSVSLHYRETKDHTLAEKMILKACEALTPKPRNVGGKKIFNLVPPSSPHKGHSLLQIMEELGKTSALFIGDDVTDEDVFRLKNKNILSIRVGESKTSKADFFLKTQNEINRLLKILTQPI